MANHSPAGYKVTCNSVTLLKSWYYGISFFNFHAENGFLEIKQ